MKYLLGKKLGMSQIWKEDAVVPVTMIEAGPATVTQVRTKAKDGYTAVQLGFGRAKRLSKPMQGHLKTLGNFRYLREFRLNETAAAVEVGAVLDASQFSEGDKIAISGTSKGRGFQGVVKRHGFHGGPKSHGQKNRFRAPGSIGSTAPQRVLPGRRMAGRMGQDRITVKNLRVVSVDPEKHLLYVRGAVPGNRGGLLEIKG